MKKLFSVAILSSALSLGCENHSHTQPPNAPNVAVEASSHDIVAGETVTLTARTRDTYGRDVKVKWSSTAGSVKVEQDGRIARVKFDDPGTYTVKATLLVDGKDYQTDMVEVHVKPVG